jgi:hypothetical protein
MIFNNHVFHSDVDGLQAEIKITDIIKRRSLRSMYRDRDYPISYTPFYLYGTQQEQHLDHMLLRAPNAQISTDLIKLSVKPEITESQLAKGVLLRLHLPERSMQPFDTEIKSLFAPKASFKVTIVDDVIDPTAEQSGLAIGGEVLAKGTVEFGHTIFWDTDRLNSEDLEWDPTP